MQTYWQITEIGTQVFKQNNVQDISTYNKKVFKFVRDTYKFKFNLKKRVHPHIIIFSLIHSRASQNFYIKEIIIGSNCFTILTNIIWENISHIFLRNHDQSLFFTSKLNLINLYICLVGEMFQFPQMVLDIGLVCMQTYKCCTNLLNRNIDLYITSQKYFYKW